MESKILNAKMTYNEALKNLEEISEEIHRLRQETKQKLVQYDINAPQIDKTESSSSIKTTDSNSSQINSTDEYLDFPMKLSLKSSPIRQKALDKHTCPHLLRDFEIGASCSKFGCERMMMQGDGDSDGENMFSPNQTDMVSCFKFSHE